LLSIATPIAEIILLCNDSDMTLEIALQHFGNRYRLAKALGIKPQAIYQWKGKIPELRQYQIRELIEKRAASA
jgi:transcriptional repressor of cell division inhibition gene dicB